MRSRSTCLIPRGDPRVTTWPSNWSSYAWLSTGGPGSQIGGHRLGSIGYLHAGWMRCFPKSRQPLIRM